MRPAERVLLLALLAATATAGADCAPLRFAGDGIPAPLLGRSGDPERGRRVALDRDRGDCTICHRLPVTDPDPRFHGNVGPSLVGVGARLSPARLRARIAAPKRLNPETIMPAYCTTGDRWRVASEQVGEPILDAGEIEDLVAWLATLRGDRP